MNGRKRHILVDTLGWLLTVVVHATNVTDWIGGKAVLLEASDDAPKLEHH
ncbi:MAG: IS5/IS1182 family transposase, partial [Synechococcaceae cyanobacterium SM2_3_1]|nr:IS5/IS1182 family transposase [Synechococcaceae cyanobacterium SM2_3_1]